MRARWYALRAMKQAVDPEKYPVLSVCREPGDGNPEWTGPDVLYSER